MKNIIIFFNNETRKKKEGENYSNILKKLIIKEFDEFFNLNKEKLFKNLNKIQDYIFLNTILNDVKVNIKTCDEVFASFIYDCATKVNKNYFLFVLKFAILFRECINVYKKCDDKTQEYTHLESPEQVPDLCNEFVSEFLDPNNFFDLDMNELIDLIVYFCNWLYFNQHTTSRLTLLS